MEIVFSGLKGIQAIRPLLEAPLSETADPLWWKKTKTKKKAQIISEASHRRSCILRMFLNLYCEWAASPSGHVWSNAWIKKNTKKQVN